MMDDDEAVLLAQEKGLPFALDHLGYDGLANIAVEERRSLTEILTALIRDYAEMWASEFGGGEDDWPDMLHERRGPDGFPAVRRALSVLGLTWDEFVTIERNKEDN